MLDAAAASLPLLCHIHTPLTPIRHAITHASSVTMLRHYAAIDAYMPSPHTSLRRAAELDAYQTLTLDNRDASLAMPQCAYAMRDTVCYCFTPYAVYAIADFTPLRRRGAQRHAAPLS